MKKLLLLIAVLLSFGVQRLCSQTSKDTLVYLLTCGTGTETYSIYGHSALRIVQPKKKSDLVYNWGVFDFETPHFAWKFANGSLDYMLAVEQMQGFLQVYDYEKRYVQSQELNLSPVETARLVAMINDNLKPENVRYRYDFFYDDCSTRIRDLIEKAVGPKLLYPPDANLHSPTFRSMVGKYQEAFPWLKFGIDLLLGSPSDKKASFRDRMFLPIDLQKELSEAVVNRDGRMTPLLRNPDLILDYDPPGVKHMFLFSPAFVFTAVLIIILIISGVVRSRKFLKWFDLTLFLLYSVLAALMIFFNFFTVHGQMRWNLNVIWLNPFIIICLGYLILGKSGAVWFRLLFYTIAGFMIINFVLPQFFNLAILPLLLIILIRSSARAGFEWNKLSIE